MAKLTTGTILGTGLSIAGTLAETQAAASADLFDARQLVSSAKDAARLERERGHRVQSAQRAGFSKAGVELTGTPLEVMAETANIAETNALKIEREAQQQATQLRHRAKDTKRAGRIKTAATLIGGL